MPAAAATPAGLLARAREQGGRLSDGRLNLAWSAVEASLQAVERRLAARGVALDAPVALECGNTTPAALTLLALLARGTTFALLPLPAPGVPPLPLPGFVRHRLTVRSAPAAQGGDPDPLLRPEGWLDVSTVEPTRALDAGSPLRRHRLLLRTSGSLEAPKLVAHTHAGAVANAQNVVDRLALEPGDRVSIPVPLAHMFGLGAAFLPALLAGASVDLLEGANLVRYLERERSVRPTVAYLTPNLCTMLVRPRAAPGHYRHVVVAGDKLDPATFQAAERIYRRVVNLYGSTEMGVVAAADARDDEGPRAATVGRPAPGVRLRLDPREDAEPGEEPCELACAHPYGFEGYLDSDGRPIPASPDPTWFRTRDLARWTPEGLLELRGRSDHAVKRDGRLVLLAELERAIGRLPDVERVATVVAGESKRGRAIVAFVVPRAGAAPDPAELRRGCQDALPPYAVPDEVRLLPALPALPSGKLDRRALARLCAPAPPVPEASPA